LPRHIPNKQHGLQFGLAPRLLCVIAVAVALISCVPSQGPGSGPATVERAERLLRQNNPAAAAQVYENLAAANPPPDGINYSLAATRAWLSANRAEDAKRVVDALTGTLSPEQKFNRDLLKADIAAASGQYAEAWRAALAIAEPKEPALAGQLFLLRQNIALQAAKPVEAVQAGMARERLAASDAERTGVRRDLLTRLRQAVDGGMRFDAAATRDKTILGWLEIGQIAAAAAHSPLGVSNTLDRWRTRFPDHPAASLVQSEIIAPGAAATPINAIANNKPVGLLLPLTGGYAGPAGLIRDGFQAAVAQLPVNLRPDVRIYDTGTLSVAAALQNASTDGVGFIVGPLTREEILQATQLPPGGVPMLLLNYLGADNAGNSSLYQFALSPEDEARQIARAAMAAGQMRALVFASADDWGNRVNTAFSEELTRAGGSVIAMGSFDPARNDFSAMIKQALRIDESATRYRRINQIVGGELKFESRRRADIDLILIAGRQALALRQIRPQLRFFGAGDIPTYMTSDGYDDNPTANRDLDGMRFPDMPWILEGSGPVAAVRSATEASWSARGQRQSRLFAFGYDAGALATALRNRQSNWPISGLTGRLTPTTQGRIERDLDWARIRDGVAQLFDPATR
jgi:uncharacterized protein